MYIIPGINIVHCQTNQGFTHITFIKEPKLESKEWKTSYCIPQEVGRPDSWGTKNRGGKRFSYLLSSILKFLLFQILSRDSVTVTVDAVVYYRVSNPTMATNNVEDYGHSTHLLGATTLRYYRATPHTS